MDPNKLSELAADVQTKSAALNEAQLKVKDAFVQLSAGNDALRKSVAAAKTAGAKTVKPLHDAHAKSLAEANKAQATLDAAQATLETYIKSNGATTDPGAAGI